MKSLYRMMAASAAALCAMTLAVPGRAQGVTFEDVRTLTRGPTPVIHDFNIPATGTYRLTLSDLAVPTDFDSLQVAVTRGDVVVGSLAAPGSVDVNITAAGSYTLRVVGMPDATARAGSFGVRLVSTVAGSAALLEFAEAIDGPFAETPTNRRTLDTTFEVASAGTYEVSLADHAFPVSLTTVTLAILRDGGSSLTAQLPAAGSTSFAATPGRYRLLVIAEAPVTPGAGAFGVRVRNTATQEFVFARSEAVGLVTEIALPDPLLAGAHQFILSDFAFPAPLSSGAALLAASGTQVARRDSPGTTNFTAAAGAHQLFVLASATAAVPGSYGLELRRGATIAFATVRTAPATDANATVRAFNYVVDVPAAGAYRLRLADFDFPQPLQTKGFAATQNGALLASLNNAGTLDLTNVAAGRLFIVALAQPPAGSPSGLLGIDLAPAAAGSALLFERTEAIGAAFFAHRVTVPSAGEYLMTVSDLRFPAQFTELAAVVSRGAERQGSVYAGGTFPFAATPGDYTVSIVAQPSLAAVFGTYGVRVAPRPAAPTVAFSADANAVANGATAMLTWTASNSTGCTASGGWSGSKAATGTERTTAITASTTFTLNCDGPGGQRSASLTITPQAAAPPGGNSSGGGGRIDILLLAALLLRMVFGRKRGPGLQAGALAMLATCLLVPGPDARAADDVLGSAVSTSTAAQAPVDERAYRIQPGDVLQVAVWKERDLQAEILVRPDGGISFPLAGDLAAGGKTVIEISGSLAEKLGRYIPDPVVTVTVKSIGGNRVYVLGKVNRPGEFAFSQPLDVMQVLALAGGATPFAAVNDIRILRRNGNRLVAVEFRYADVESGRKLEQNIVLRSGDTVVVP